jgi:hypothetical protein
MTSIWVAAVLLQNDMIVEEGKAPAHRILKLRRGAYALAASPGGKRRVTAGAKGGVHVREVEKNQQRPWTKPLGQIRTPTTRSRSAFRASGPPSRPGKRP